MAGLYVNDAGTWKAATPWVNDAGTWKKPLKVWANDGGVWKQVWVQVTATFSPVAGTYSRTDNGRIAPTASSTGASFRITASASVVWTWSVVSGGTGFTATIASGGSGTVIDFNLAPAATSATRTTQFTVSAGGSSWTITLTASGNGGGGATMTL